MKDENIKALHKLSAFCRYVGMISVFLGIAIVAMDVAFRDWLHLQVGIFVFASGYAYVKIGAKVSSLIFDERTERR